MAERSGPTHSPDRFRPIWAVGLIGGAIALCVGGNWLFNRAVDEPIVQLAPSGDLGPEFTPTPSGPQGAFVEVPLEPTATSVPESCMYSAPYQYLSPLPSGEYSPFQHYYCSEGFWDAGEMDAFKWNPRWGYDWGEDGVLEHVYIKYGPNGKVADRIAFRDGIQIDVPTK
ncbi:MAG: hypothetical protein Q7S31_00310 [bacterium]|nr:hypothetical protein [bacterium]